MSHTEHENEGEELNLGWDTNPGHTICYKRNATQSTSSGLQVPFIFSVINTK